MSKKQRQKSVQEIRKGNESIVIVMAYTTLLLYICITCVTIFFLFAIIKWKFHSIFLFAYTEWQLFISRSSFNSSCSKLHMCMNLNARVHDAHISFYYYYYYLSSRRCAWLMEKILWAMCIWLNFIFQFTVTSDGHSKMRLRIYGLSEKRRKKWRKEEKHVNVIYDLSSKLHLKIMYCLFFVFVHSFECCRFNLI